MDDDDPDEDWLDDGVDGDSLLMCPRERLVILSNTTGLSFVA